MFLESKKSHFNRILHGWKFPFALMLAFSLLSAVEIFAADTPPDFSGFTEVGSTGGKYGEFRFKINWKPDEGQVLAIADKDKKNQCIIQLKKNKGGITFLGNTMPSIPGQSINIINPLPDKPIPELECVLKLHQYSWSIYFDNKEVYRIPPAFAAETFWLKNQTAGTIGKIRFQKTAPLYFHDDFLIADKDANQLDAWEIHGGKWQIHTVLESAIEQKSSPNLKSRPVEMERSPNFYSLKGSGEKGLIVSGYPFHDDYVVQAAIQVQKGESGLAFYVQDESNFYTFTIYLVENGEGFALLKKHLSGKQPLIMKAVKLEILPDQWIMPRIKVIDNHIDAYVDNVKIMSVDEMLPPGGQFGLYVNSPQEMVFDDFTAESIPYLKLDDLQDVKFHSLMSQGDVFYKAGLFDWLFGKGSEKQLFPGKDKKDRWLVFGSAADKVAVAGVSLKLRSYSSSVGLLFGWKGNESPFYRLLYSRAGAKCYVRLEKMKMGTTEPEILETSELPDPGRSMDVSLKAEFSPDGMMKFFCNDSLAIVRREANAPVGATGIFVGKGTEASVGNLVCRFKPEEVFRDKQEKNEIYENDPYMRNWANPAGQWIKDEKEKGFWHKSDFFSAYSLDVPIADNTEIHLGAREEQPNGDLLVKIAGPDFEISEISSGKSLLKKPTAEIFKKDKDGKAPTAYRLSLQDNWLFGECGNELSFKLKLENKPAGSGIFIRGFSDANLLAMRATRDNVLDFLFNEAPYEWTKNGGDWQVINRFQCDPRWSHMNGQSADDLASLWSKYNIEGDFCIEMYAGMRHGDWYQRVGDLNLTVLNRKEMPSEGYTFICSGWDPDHSQTESRLLREGKIIAESDKYLTPRWRDGNVRKYFDTLLGRDRDVHGAWYYLKAHRIGDLVEYYFDDQKVFSVHDKEPLCKGGFGIWTFMNSMMVARVKIAAGKITPREFSFSEVDPAKIPLGEQKTAVGSGILLNGLPANLMTASSWQQSDSAGAPKLSFFKNGIKVENILGAGKFAAEAKGLDFPESGISAWTCEIKRTENAGFNFHFELGRKNAKGEYVVMQRYFYQITGTDYSKDIFQLVGSTGEIKPVKLHQLCTDDGWTRVWFPVPYILSRFGSSKDYIWKVIGFGNFQPSDILQGLKGNGPGEAYAIRNFTAVFNQAPVVSFKNPEQPAADCQFLLDGTMIKGATLDEFNKNLKAIVKQGIVSGKLLASAGKEQTELIWTMPEDESKWNCRWDTDKQNSILITTDANYRFLNNDRLAVKVQGVELPVEEFGVNKFRVSLLERMDEDFRKLLQNDSVEIEIFKGGKSKKVSLPWKDCKALAPPILAKLEGITPFFQSFENNELRKRVRFDSNRMMYVWDKDRNNSCFVVFNRLKNQRLRTEFSTDLSIAKYPIIQFMYKTDPMGQISLNLRDNTLAYLDEPHMDARKVRFGSELLKDGKWHSWTGFATDAFDKSNYSSTIFRIPRIAFGSFYKEDQTGKNSQLYLDDVVCGPAVRGPDQLAFTPCYFDMKEDVKVYTAIINGEKTYFEMNDDARKKISWKEIANNVKFVPDIGNLQDGVHQLLLKAVGKDGRESQVTSIPFLLDRSTKTANFAFKTSEDPTYNGSYLQIEWQNKNGAPLNLDSLTTSFAGTKVDIDRHLSKIEHRQDAEIININWPYMLRTKIDKMNNGDTGELLVAGLEDGAGNKTPDLHIPIKINYAEDKLPPTFLRPILPDDVLFHLDYSCDSYDKLPVNMQNIRSKVIKEGSNSFVRFSGTNGAGTLTVISRKRRNVNDLDFDSHLAMKLRFPHKDIPKNASLMLEVKYSDNKNVQLGLLDGKIAETDKTDKSVDIKNNNWQDFVVDLQELYKKKFGDKEDRKKVRIKEVNLIARDLNTNDLFDMALFSIFRDFSPDDKFTLDAYDQSGIADMTWELTDASGNVVGNGICEGRSLTMKQLQPGEGVQWLKLAFSDKAGNKTSPLVFPIIMKKPAEAQAQQKKEK